MIKLPIDLIQNFFNSIEGNIIQYVQDINFKIVGPLVIIVTEVSNSSYCISLINIIRYQLVGREIQLETQPLYVSFNNEKCFSIQYWYDSQFDWIHATDDNMWGRGKVFRIPDENEELFYMIDYSRKLQVKREISIMNLLKDIVKKYEDNKDNISPYENWLLDYCIKKKIYNSSFIGRRASLDYGIKYINTFDSMRKELEKDIKTLIENYPQY